MERHFIRTFALDAHGDQRYGQHTYIYHLDRVVEVLERHGYPSSMVLDLDQRPDRLIAAGYLHDVLEDTEVDYATLTRAFGSAVADLVLAVTNTPGTRRQRKEATYARISSHPDGPELKLADRIANVEESIRTGSSLLKMYRREWPEFEQRLRPVGGSPELWNVLSGLLGAR
ncbi:MAG: HD domain-containing protein [Myxococcota bacterium]